MIYVRKGCFYEKRENENSCVQSNALSNKQQEKEANYSI